MTGRRRPVLQPCGQTTILRSIALISISLGLVAAVLVPSAVLAGDGPTAGPRFFPETGHNVPDYFAGYWDAHGGLAQFGLPITEPYSREGRTIQWFERARFERHVENKGTAYEVLLGQLGREMRPADDPAPASADPAALYLPEVGHNLALFRAYWEENGGLARFGFPLSEELWEVNQADGRTYAVQYFERARLEYHPEGRGTRFEVLLGLIGVEQYRIARDDEPAVAPPARPATPTAPPATPAAPQATPTAPPASPAPAAPAAATIETLLWQTINADRAAAGVPPLALDPLVSRAAAIHVADMVAHDFLEHTGTDGSRAVDRMRRVGVQVQWGSENISMECAKDPATAARNIRAWMMAEPLAEGVYNHRWNIMYKGYTRVGIAFGVARNGCWVVSENFADGTPAAGSQAR